MSKERADELCSSVACDIEVFVNTRSRQGYAYFFHLTCVASKKIWLYGMINKSEAFDILKEWHLNVVTACNYQWKHFRFDGGKELNTPAVETWLSSHGVNYVTSPRDTPELNGIAENTSKIIGHGARALIVGSGLPPTFGFDAADTSVFQHNIMPTDTTRGCLLTSLMSGSR